MQKGCNYYQNNNSCYFGKTNNIHVGTEDKLDFVDAYVKAWIYKICQFKLNGKLVYNRLIFIDCMCSSGKYRNSKGEQLEGTSLRVYKNFIKLSDQFNNTRFLLMINDFGKQETICQKCRLENMVQRGNIEIDYSPCLDVKDYLVKYKNKKMLKNKDHVLLYYDPYQAMIYWQEIRYFLEGLHYDLILTHFHQMDSSRGIATVKKSDKIKKYEITYGISIDELKLLVKGLNNLELKEKLRDLLSNQISKQLGISKNNIAIAPVVNSKNKDLYDIVFVSHSMAAKQLFKKTMYTVMSKRIIELGKNFSQEKMMLFDEEYNYQNARPYISEIEYYFSVVSYAKIVINKFANQSISNDELKQYLTNHEFIPCEGILKELKKELKKKNVRVTKSGYDFRNIEKGS